MPPAGMPGCGGRGARVTKPYALRLSVGPGSHYLVDGNGAPFQIRGDAGWSLAVQCTREKVCQYLDDRRQRGFNAVLFSMIEHKFATAPPANAYGDSPFTGAAFTTSLNSAYWSHIDYVVDQMAVRGMVAIADGWYYGFGAGDEGWYGVEITAAGATAMQSYAATLAARYVNKDNLIWVLGGDYQPPDITITNAISAGVRSADTRHLITGHWARDSTGTDGGVSNITLNSSYTQQADVSSRVVADYQLSPTRPTLLIEDRYFGEGAPTVTAAGVRQQHYQAILQGACGRVYGDGGIWAFSSGWESNLASAGAVSMAYAHEFFSNIAWWKLVPDASSALVIAGRNTIGTTSYVSAALSADGKLGVVYIPAGGAVDIAMSQFTGTVTARWYDPSANTYAAVSGSPFANSGTQSLTPPGGAERVLLLEAA